LELELELEPEIIFERTGPGTGFLVSFTWGFFVLNICETGIRTGNHHTIVFFIMNWN
jgi:hypothetical protein